MPIARQRIRFPKGALTGAARALLTGELGEGDAVARLEQTYVDHIGAAAAVAVPSARGGLQFALESLELAKGAEVICAGFGYPAVPHVARSVGCKLRFADIETRTLGMDPDALERMISDETAAVIVTHLYGVPCRIRELAEICRAHGALLVEDCAHCFSASVGGQRVGSFGDLAYFSFETSKMINTMGGGMLTVASTEVAERIRERLRKEPAKTPRWLVRRVSRTAFEATVTHPLVFGLGVYNGLRLASGRGDDDRFASGYHADEISMQGRLGRFTELQARLALRQIAELPPRLERRITNAERLLGRLREHVEMQEPAGDDVRADYMLVTAQVPYLEQLVPRLLRAGIDTKHHYMRDCAAIFDPDEPCERSARAEQEVLHLPAYPELGPAQIDRVAAAVLAATGDSVARTPAPATASDDRAEVGASSTGST